MIVTCYYSFYLGYEEDETYEYDESGYYAVGQGEEEQRYAFQPPRKVAKGEKIILKLVGFAR